jgi:hypothetical protein
MKRSLALRLAAPFALALLVACSSAPDAPPGASAAALESRPPAISIAPPPRVGGTSAHLVAALAGGGLALVDAWTGARVAVAEAGPAVRDLDVDSASERVIAVRGEDDDLEIVAHPLLRGGLGGAEHLAWIDGDARVASTAAGLLVFESGWADRWRLLGAGARPLSFPPPRSIALEDGATVRALVPRSPGLEVDRVARDGGLVARPVVASFAGAEPPGGARFAAAPALGLALLARLDRGVLELSGSDARGELGAPIWRGLVGDDEARLEALVPVEGGRLVALLVAKPARLVVVAPAEGTSTIVALRGAVRLEPRFFSREMVASGPRLFVATTAGVAAFSVGPRTAAPEVARDEAFQGDGLEGPLATAP